MIEYRLSNAQRKELLVRNVPLAIAIPIPPDEPDDPMAYCCAVLPEDCEYITAVDEVEVFARPKVGGDGLTALLDDIVRQPKPGTLVVRIAAYEVHLDPPKSRRKPNARQRLQWPGKVIEDEDEEEQP